MAFGELGKLKVLFVDDSDAILNLMKHKFGDNFLVFTSLDPIEGLEIKKKEGIKLIISDLQMPGKDGIQFCMDIKQDDPLSVVVGYTGAQKLFELVNCRIAGFDDYLLKENDIGLLQKVLDEYQEKISRWLKR